MHFFKRSPTPENEVEQLGTWPIQMRKIGITAEFEMTVSEQPEIFVIHSGRAILNDDSGASKQAIAEGTVIILHPGDHEILNSVQALSMTAIRFLPEWFSDAWETLFSSADATALWARMFFFQLKSNEHRPQVFTLDSTERPAVESDLSVIHNELRRDDIAHPSREGLAKHTLLKIFLHLATAHGKFWRGEQHMKWTKELPDLLSLFERTAGRGSRMNLRQASKESRINEAMLVETFGQWTGMPPMKYLERRRAQHAARQMLAGRATDDTIAERTGFNNLARFGEQMKATFGRSAAEYRSDFCS